MEATVRGVMIPLLLLFCAVRLAVPTPLTLAHNSTRSHGIFCCIVHQAKADEPPDLSREQRKSWYSRPELSIVLEVEAHLLQVFDVTVATVTVGEDDLSGRYNVVHFAYVVADNKVHSLEVYVDDKRKVNTIASTSFHTTDSTFKGISIYAKGPLTFDWDNGCSDKPSDTSNNDISKPPVVVFFTDKTPDISNTDIPIQPIVILFADKIPDTLNNDITTRASFGSVNIIHDNNIHDNDNNSDSDGNASTPLSNAKMNTIKNASSYHSAALWAIFICLFLIVVLFGVAGVLYFLRQRKRRDMQHIRNIDAEKQKQRMICDAKRMSYQEQLKWAEAGINT